MRETGSPTISWQKVCDEKLAILVWQKRRVHCWLGGGDRIEMAGDEDGETDG
jgi:hypothetical protein